MAQAILSEFFELCDREWNITFRLFLTFCFQKMSKVIANQSASVSVFQRTTNFKNKFFDSLFRMTFCILVNFLLHDEVIKVFKLNSIKKAINYYQCSLIVDKGSFTDIIFLDCVNPIPIKISK